MHLNNDQIGTNFDNFTYDKIFEIGKIFFRNQIITSASYDRNLKYRNSVLINKNTCEMFKILNFFVIENSGEKKLYSKLIQNHFFMKKRFI